MINPVEKSGTSSKGTVSAVKNPWEQAAAEVLAGLEVTPERGLSIAEAQRRQQIYGLNILQEIKPKNPWLVLIEQFKSLIVGLLVIACVLSFIFGDWIEGLAIIVVILINAAIGFLTEMKAVRSMEALRKLTQVTSVVRREGQAQQINAQDMVPGDVVILEGGDIVAADLRLIETSKLQADESTLTGESEPVNKHTEPLQGETLLAERYNMLYKGTSVVRGSGIGVVTSIGMQTELGQISALVQKAKSERTPLEKRLDQLGQNLIYVTIGITVLIAVLGIIKGKEALLMIETAIALAVAAIPEGLPIVATIALARGMLRMAERNALINRLASVETLGATTVICTDKTGTLTENKMTVTKYILGSGEYEVLHDDFRRGGQKIEPIESPDLVEALKIGTLCNGASLSAKSGEGQADGVGDPLEVALLVAARKAGILRSALLDKLPKVNEEAFDSDVKMMATIHGNNGGFLVAVKGAPENVLDASSHEYGQQGAIRLSKERRAHWMGANNSLASKGLRVLALAQKSAESAQVKPYENLIFIGLVALSDPPRADIRDAINLCQAAGIRVVMVTGDQPVTAKRIAFETGMVAREDVAVISGKDLKTIEEMNAEERHALTEAAIFARVSPRQKLDIIAAHQARQAVVAMTGDGVNDAPALKKADIGIAMGLRGTQVAREAADMVLKDDAFSTIVVAVEQGRIIFENIRKFVLFLLSCNVSEIAVVAIASFFSTHLPILPLQILFINLVTDVFPALALGVGKGEPRIMEKPPRPAGESILTGRHWVFVALFGMLISAATLGAFGIALNKYHMDPSRIVTISFLTLAFAQLWHTFNMRASGSRFIRNEITRNPAVWGAIVFCGGLLVLAVYTPILARVLNLVDPGLEGWLIVLVMSLMPWAAGQIIRSLRK